MPQATGGIKIRVVFSPLTDIVSVGQGCVGTGGKRPVLSSRGTPKLNNVAFFVDLKNARPNTQDALVFGTDLLAPTAVNLGGDCRLWTEPLILLLGKTNAQGADDRILPAQRRVELPGRRHPLPVVRRGPELEVVHRPRAVERRHALAAVDARLPLSFAPSSSGSHRGGARRCTASHAGEHAAPSKGWRRLRHTEPAPGLLHMPLVCGRLLRDLLRIA